MTDTPNQRQVRRWLGAIALGLTWCLVPFIVPQEYRMIAAASIGPLVGLTVGIYLKRWPPIR